MRKTQFLLPRIEHCVTNGAFKLTNLFEVLMLPLMACSFLSQVPFEFVAEISFRELRGCAVEMREEDIFEAAVSVRL